MFCRLILFPLLMTGAVALPLERPLVMGASVSSGLHINELMNLWGHPKSDALALDLALEDLLEKDVEIPNIGNRYVFFAIERFGESQVDRALEHQPTAVFALDFLFWYLYGHFQGNVDAGRLQRLESGLAQLDRLMSLRCPVILGDLPDAKSAIYHVLAPVQVPDHSLLQKANQRLREWASQRQNIVILPLSSFMEKVDASEKIDIAGVKIPKKDVEQLLQRDRLHPTKAGVKALAKASLALLKRSE